MFPCLAIVALAAASRVTAPDYNEVVSSVAEMTWNYEVCDMASGFGLDVVNVTWEDTGFPFTPNGGVSFAYPNMAVDASGRILKKSDFNISLNMAGYFNARIIIPVIS